MTRCGCGRVAPRPWAGVKARVQHDTGRRVCVVARVCGGAGGAWHPAESPSAGARTSLDDERARGARPLLNAVSPVTGKRYLAIRA